MQKYLSLIIITILLASCALTKKPTVEVYLNYIEPIYTKDDVRYRDKIIAANRKFADSCEKNNLECIMDPFEYDCHFAGGAHNFFKLFYSNFTNSFRYNSSITNIDFIVNRNGKIENIIVHSKNKKLEKEIIKVLSSECMNKWKPSYIGRMGIQTKIQMRLIIKK